MSYEGFTRSLCAKGHLSCWDAYDESESCHEPECKEEFVWDEMIDTTNGHDPKDETKLAVSHPAEYCKCDKCNHTHETKRARYHIPKVQ